VLIRHERIPSHRCTAHADRVVQLLKLSLHQTADHYRRDAHRSDRVAGALHININDLAKTKVGHIQSESGDEGHVAITFDDESTLKLRVAGQATVRVGAKVEAVHEAGEHFQVDLEEGPSVQAARSNTSANATRS
jgi:hypothetical protein